MERLSPDFSPGSWSASRGELNSRNARATPVTARKTLRACATSDHGAVYGARRARHHRAMQCESKLAAEDGGRIDGRRVPLHSARKTRWACATPFRAQDPVGLRDSIPRARPGGLARLHSARKTRWACATPFRAQDPVGLPDSVQRARPGGLARLHSARRTRWACATLFRAQDLVLLRDPRPRRCRHRDRERPLLVPKIPLCPATSRRTRGP